MMIAIVAVMIIVTLLNIEALRRMDDRLDDMERLVITFKALNDDIFHEDYQKVVNNVNNNA